MANPVQKVPSRQNLRNNLGLAREFGFLEFNTLDMVEDFDDFMGDQITDEWEATSSGTGSSAAAVVQDSANGEILMTGGTANGASYNHLQRGSSHFQGQLNACIAVRIKPSLIAGNKVEIGLVDTAANLGFVETLGNAAATTTVRGTNGVVWVWDAAYDTDVWQMVGAKAGTVVKNADDGAPAAVADTYQTLVLAITEDSAEGYILDNNGYQIWSTGPLADAVTSTTGLTPWVNTTCVSSASSCNVTVDYVKAWQRRTAD